MIYYCRLQIGGEKIFAQQHNGLESVLKEALSIITGEAANFPAMCLYYWSAFVNEDETCEL